MEHLLALSDEQAYIDYKASSAYIEPHVCYLYNEDNLKVIYKKKFAVYLQCDKKSNITDNGETGIKIYQYILDLYNQTEKKQDYTVIQFTQNEEIYINDILVTKICVYAPPTSKPQVEFTTNETDVAWYSLYYDGTMQVTLD